MLRLLFVTHSLSPVDQPLANLGGMQRVATELYETLRQGEAVDFSTLALRGSWQWRHITVPVFMAKSLWQLRHLARTQAVDVVLFSSMVTAALAVPLRRTFARHGILTATINHGQDVTLPVAPYQWFVRQVFGALDVVMPVSSATGAACLARGLSPEKLHVVPNGVDTSRFAARAPKPEMRRALLAAHDDPQHPMPSDALLLCSVGRQVKRKGFAWFIEHVMPQLPASVHYWLAGDGPERPAIEAAIARHGLHRRVRLLGRVSDTDLKLLYRGADLFVMPNIRVPGDMEGFGVVMLEAALSGTPALAAALEGILDVITEGVNGHLVPTEEAAAYVAALQPYLTDRARLAALADRAYTHTVETFTWPAVARRYLAVLEAAAAKKAKAHARR